MNYVDVFLELKSKICNSNINVCQLANKSKVVD